jgi:chorismate synthase
MNSFGKLFRITTWGESHGPAVGVVIDGCPPGIPLSESDIEKELERRRPGRPGTSPRKEPDKVEILSGVYKGLTTGTPISLLVWNKDVDSRPYEELEEIFRPGHADWSYFHKYGIRDPRGGGRSSARETVGRVAAGAVAKKILDQEGIEVFAFTLELGGIRSEEIDLEFAKTNWLCCPDPKVLSQMEKRLKEVQEEGDSVGGIVEIRVFGCPPGLGEPVFDKLDADLAKALMSIGAIKGVEVGSGFSSARMLGSEHNDPLTPQGFLSNNAGGILGGISTGQPIILRVAVKPIPSISKPQMTIDLKGNPREISLRGRHDPCAIPRIIPVCEAMVRLVLVDHLLRQKALRRISSFK